MEVARENDRLNGIRKKEIKRVKVIAKLRKNKGKGENNRIK